MYRDTGLELAGESEELVPAAGGGEAGELSRALLGVVAAILFLELVLAWRFGTRRRLATP
jgi:hypothetical protein